MYALFPYHVGTLAVLMRTCLFRHRECIHIASHIFYRLSQGRDAISPKVLIVDDEFLIRWSLTQVLSEEDYEVAAVEDGQKAVDMAAAERFDFVITDLAMPGLDGWGVLDKLMEFQVPPRVIIMTADAAEEHRKLAERKGASGIIEKSCLIEEIKRVLKAGSRK